MTINFNQRKKKNFLVYLSLFFMIPALCSCDSDDDEGYGFTVTLSHSKGAQGDAVKLNGTGFGADKNAVQVYFGTASATINSIDDKSVEVTVPPGSEGSVVDVYMQSGNKNSNRIPFTYIKHQPSISEISMASGLSGEEMQLFGTGFGRNKDAVGVMVGDKPAEITEFSSTYIKFLLPEGGGAIETEIYVTVAGVSSGKVSFRYTDHLPQISSLGEYKGLHRETLLINGSGFNTAQDGNQVLFDNVEADVLSATDRLLEVEVPYIYKNKVALRVMNRDYPNEYSNEQIFSYDLNACDSIAIVGSDWTVDRSIRDDIVLRYGRMFAFNSTQTINYIEIPIGDDIEIGVENFTGTLQLTTTMCKRVGAFAGINGSYFTWDPVGSADYLRYKGVELVSAASARKSPSYVDGALVINGTNDVSVARQSMGSASGPGTPGETVVTSGPVLRYGSVTLPMANHAHNTDRHPRTGFGITSDGRILLVVVDGRKAGVAAGVTNAEFAKVMQFLGADQAINFDGGGSSTLFVDGFGNNGIVNTPSDGSERVGANVIYAKFK